MFSPDAIQQVTAANDIVEVIGSYVPLKRMGSRYGALCPFHREKSPSFSVDPGRQRYHCFGCAADGDVIRFVMNYESLDFPAAVRRLAEKAGIAIVEEKGSGGSDGGGAGELKRRLLALHGEAADWFHRNLMKTPGAAAARDYLKSRGLSAEVAASWKIGYAPDSFRELLSWGQGRGYTLDELVQSGLVKPKDDSFQPSAENPAPKFDSRNVYDRFRDRLMFAICNEPGQPIAFSGRVLTADAKSAKYVNSPETPIFTKGKVLFGLHKSKPAILDMGFAIVCEGQIDLITAFEAGIQNVIAPQGTAFTERQAQVLKRQVDEVVLCFDSDAAGQKAAERSFAVLLESNLSVRVATMPPGEDPDSMIRQRGAEAFAERIGAAKDFFDFQIERLSSAFDLNTPRGKMLFARKIAESVALLTDSVLREATIFKVTARLGISPDAFRSLLKGQPRSSRAAAPDLMGGGQSSEAPTAEAPFEKPPRTVANLLRLAVENPEARAWLLEQPWRELLPKIAGAELLFKTLAADFQPEHSATVNAFLGALAAGEEAFLSNLLRDKPFPQPMIVARDCWLDLERTQIKERRAALESRMRLPGLSDEETTQLQKEILDLQKRLTDIARP